MLSVMALPPEVGGRRTLLPQLYGYQADPKRALAVAVRLAIQEHAEREWRRAQGAAV